MTHSPWSRACALTVLTAAFAACGGRAQLVPAHQIGRLSSSAVVGADAGVRVVVRTDAWPGPPLVQPALMAVEVRYANGSTQPLVIRHDDIALVTPSGQDIGPTVPADLPVAGPVAEAATQHALVEGVLPPQEQVFGFVYFIVPPGAERLNLRVDLVSAASGEPFGAIEMPFTLE